MTLDQHVENSIRRAKAFYNSQNSNYRLINAIIPTETPLIPPLFDFDLDRQLTEWLDYNLEANRPVWAMKEGIDDDYIPSICPRFGIAEHSAWLGMDVIFQEITCLPVPKIKSMEDLEQLKLDENDKWFQYMKKGYAYLNSKKDGSFLVSMRGTMMPMDIANAIRGDELFTDFLLEPEIAHEIMKFLVKAIQWYYGHLKNWTENVDGGFVYFLHNGWMPDTFIGHLSNDAAMLCSPKVYDEFGFPYEKELVENYNGMLYHVHNEQLHFIPKVIDLPNLTLLEISDDPKTTPTIEDLPRILSLTGNTNLMLHATSDQIRTHLKEVGNRNIFFWARCTDRKDAEDLVHFVRENSSKI